MKTHDRKQRLIEKHVDALVMRLVGAKQGCREFNPNCPQCRASLTLRRNWGMRFAMAEGVIRWWTDNSTKPSTD